MTLNAIIANFQTFKIVDLLDIIIIAFLIYQLLGIINRTRAGQLAKGALLVLAVYLVANVLNMRTVTWLLNSLLQVGLLTLVVLFQPEIRRALERMGQTDQWASKLFNVKGRYNDPSLKGAWRSAIIAICDAAERFSETKTGALIVLERHTNLSEIVRTGTPVNSAVNLEVLGTIFYEGTPLHDGGGLRAAAFQQSGSGQGYGHPPPRLSWYCGKLRRYRHCGQRGDRHHLHGQKWCADPSF